MRTLVSSLAAALGCTILFASCAGNVASTPPPVRPLSKSESAIVEADNTFGLRLFRELDREKRDSNVFISPLSISMALGMTLNGARGTTADSMRATLALHGLTQDDINASYRSLIDLLRGIDPQVTMGIANSIWYRPELSVEQPFIDANRRYFDAEVTELDFTDPNAPTRINSWVNTATRGTIPTIIQQIPREMVMYLINAIYFKGSWTTEFDPDSTRSGEFTRRDGGREPIRLMFRSGKFHYYSDSELQAVELPYGYDRYTMTILLPKQGADINGIVGRLDHARWAQITGGLDSADGMVLLPKLKLTWEERLNDWLRRMGMNVAFDSEADFTGIDRNGGLYISEVKHKTYVEIDEKGTVASAVTSVGVGRTSLPQLFEMRMDRPFIFAIREKTSGAILFIGKVMEP
jgi:serine protease inhibitor